ncbi:MAG: acyl-CoA reductase [Gemmatimonadetes bacterium]|nr:acyl-CoA reductase [Gemmatimonadota bacterium]
MTPIDAFHLPGLKSADIPGWQILEFGGVPLRTPVLDASAMARLIEKLRRARARFLAELPVAEIVRAVDAAAALLSRPGDPRRALAEQAMPAVTGYSPAMLRLVLDRALEDWRAPALEALLRNELGDAALLDGFRPRPHGRGAARALGPELAFHIFAGNVPGVAVTALIRCLLVKAAILGKTASGEPLLPVLFARALEDVAPRLAQCLAVTYWPGGAAEGEAEALRAADTVIVYGAADAVAAVRRQIAPPTSLVIHGPRFSFGVVGRTALAEPALGRVAAQAAAAVAAFDQQGCVSPHLLYVEQGGQHSPEQFAARLALELGTLERELPRGRLSAAEAAQIHEIRATAEFRALAGQDIRIEASPGTEYTVLYEADPNFAPSCLNRLVRVKPVAAAEEVVPLVRPYAAFLQTVGVAGLEPQQRQALAEQLGRLGASRVTGLAQMPWPPPEWHHDGHEPLRELVRWIDLEGDEGETGW